MGEESPSIKKKRVEHIIELEDRDYADHWRSCCGCEIDRRAALFFSQMAISIILIGLCIVKLGMGGMSCEAETVYVSMLTSIVSYWLPAPRA